MTKKHQNSKMGSTNHFGHLKSFVGGNVVALGAGTPYLFSFYAPQLLSKCHIPVSASSKLSFSLTIGSSLMGILAGIVVDRSPKLSCLIGSMCVFIAYLILNLCYKHEWSSTFLISLSLVLIGYGSVSGFYASVKCANTNFPQHRGTAGAFPVSLYGLSGMVFSYLCSKLFGENIEHVFIFLMVACGSMILVGYFSLDIFSNAEGDDASIKEWELQKSRETDDNIVPLYENSNDYIGSPVRSSSPATYETYALSDNFQETSEFFALEDRQLSNRPLLSPSSPHTKYDFEDENTSKNTVGENSAQKSMRLHVFQSLKSSTFIGYYIVLGILQGVGLMYIYSVGFMVQAQVSTPPLNQLPINAEKIQSLQVTLLSLLSFCGRLSSGPISDFLVKKFKAQRLWNIVIASLLVFLASNKISHDFSSIEDPSLRASKSFKNISVCSAIFGYSFGVLFGTFPSIVADRFGTNGYSTLWGVLTTGGVFSVSVFTDILGRDFKANTGDDDGNCKKGVLCYSYTFMVTKYCAAFNLLFVLGIIGYTYYRRRATANPL
ncbi:CPA_1a_G0042380.mRNA.1.CDS.1 [Saccharomyces cerevisiae]|nr:CPA_1a_G0042380.mRNA.1.CDS.1 [Saccharomyces cerevisiae]CAI4681767.1 CPI_1c_G0041380.mRNA.1.CDS.1 [Saccharomyces cerevisiae]CAI4693786.1 BBM_1a_G0041620.mRNA.1.CDS.1 [Saccharomyces cerevisiae]CAI7274415.1 BBM_1a_G0041620.mRNA.1.CDS.1 [Saccharomyces cerevisiae]CAI7427455.1 CPI_1c_G0041380.mRNA.1.CDS.1 [Saccharomyces cerevisiae]